MTHQNGRHDECLILEVLHNLQLLFAVRLGEVHSPGGVPGARLAETAGTELHHVQGEVCAEALVVELDDVGEASYFHLEG